MIAGAQSAMMPRPRFDCSDLDFLPGILFERVRGID
jgi:hypothetical protein